MIIQPVTLKNTYPSEVNVVRVRFPIHPYDIVAVTSYADNELKQTVGAALGVVLTREFTDERGTRETKISYMVYIFGGIFPNRGTSHTATSRFHPSIFNTFVLGFENTMQRNLIHLRNIHLLTYCHLFGLLASYCRDEGVKCPYHPKNKHIHISIFQRIMDV